MTAIARLHSDLVTASGRTPERWLALAHGICGTGSNLRGIARAVVDRRPEWGVALLDLRGHGRSDNGEPPHTIEACAADVIAAHPSGEAWSAIAGHSFGGKVALAARRLATVAQTWVLDASPSARARVDGDHVVARLLATLDRLPRAWAKRDDFVAAVIADGHVESIARWIAMSLRPEGQGYALRFDLAQIHAMIASYAEHDAWDTLALPGDVEVVVASRESALTRDDVVRLEALEARGGRVHVHHVDAGHWVHVDAPAALVNLLTTKLA